MKLTNLTSFYVALLLFSSNTLHADWINFKARGANEKSTRFPGKLQSIDINREIATFNFRVKNGWQLETIHISRILSIYFEPSSNPNKNITFRKSIKDNIGGNLHRERAIYVTPSFKTVYDTIVNEGEGQGSHIFGIITSYSSEKEEFIIEANTRNWEKIEISVPARMITGWVR